MSLNIKTANGLQRIAGSTVILDATTSELRSGTFSLSGTTNTWATQDITFTTPMPDINYVINIESNYISGGSQTPYRITNKTVNGFTLSLYVDYALNYTGTYYAIRLVELEGYTEVQNKVDNPDSSPTENSTNLVTSGGVYEAIQNATKVFIGTEQEWEDETDKTKFQLAVLTDRTQINAVDETTGDTEVVADKTKRFTGTQAEWDALTSGEKAEYEIVCLTDDGETGNSTTQILFDESSLEYQVGLYKRADGKVKPIYRKDWANVPMNTQLLTDVDTIVKVDDIGCYNSEVFNWGGGNASNSALNLNYNSGTITIMPNSPGSYLYGNVTKISVFFTKTTDEWR